MVRIEFGDGFAVDIDKPIISFRYLQRMRDVLIDKEQPVVVESKPSTKPGTRKKSLSSKKYRSGIGNEVLRVMQTGRKMDVDAVATKLGMRGKKSKNSIYNALHRLKHKKLLSMVEDGGVQIFGIVIKEILSSKSKSKEPPKKNSEWSESEKKRLTILLSQVRGRTPNDWQLIADMMGRPRASCGVMASKLRKKK